MGYKEIVLTGVNVGDFGKKNETTFLRLLHALDAVDGIQRIRISSIEPNLLTDELVDYWIRSEKICNHFHIPLQNGTDEILKQMRRRYTSSYYKNLIYSIREKDPDAGIGVDVIVGFPGETEDLFEKNFNFIHELPVSYLHVFTYSERPNTPSIGFPGSIEPRIRFSHSERLRNLGQMKKSEFYRSQRGTVRPALIEGTVEKNRLSGYTDNYVRIEVPYHPSLENTIVDLRIGEFTGETCDADIVGIASSAIPLTIELPLLTASVR
jgi:threonylcarbamoyladenosine tRNA methylthiotransferase MtaB